MASRNFKRDAGNYSQGLVYLEFSFATNGASNPVITGASSTLRGCASPDVVTSITYSATGNFAIQLADKYRYVVTKYCDLEDLGTQDGAYATAGPVTNEGSATTGLAITVHTWTAGGVATQPVAGRRISVTLCCKNSTVGV